MPIPLSKRCLKVAERLFEEPRRSEVISRLLNEASENLPFWDKRNPTDMDRIRFSDIKLPMNSPSAISVLRFIHSSWFPFHHGSLKMV